MWSCSACDSSTRIERELSIELDARISGRFMDVPTIRSDTVEDGFAGQKPVMPRAAYPAKSTIEFPNNFVDSDETLCYFFRVCQKLSYGIIDDIDFCLSSLSHS